MNDAIRQQIEDYRDHYLHLGADNKAYCQMYNIVHAYLDALADAEVISRDDVGRIMFEEIFK